MPALKKRRPLFTDAERRKRNLPRAVRAFHARQRERAAKVQHPKPEKAVVA